MAVHQLLRFRLIVFIDIDSFVASGEIQGVLATLFGGQCITRTTEEYTSASSSNHHWTITELAGNIGFSGGVGTHTCVLCLGTFHFLTEITIETIQQIFPVQGALGNLIQVLFHGGSKAIVH